MGVSAEKFVELWQKASSAAEVAKATGVTIDSACVRASLLRKRGVPLKVMRAPLDIVALAKLAKKHAPKESPDAR